MCAGNNVNLEVQTAAVKVAFWLPNQHSDLPIVDNTESTLQRASARGGFCAVHHWKHATEPRLTSNSKRWPLRVHFGLRTIQNSQWARARGRFCVVYHTKHTSESIQLKNPIGQRCGPPFSLQADMAVFLL
eukprot:1634171-Pyramimonas_sp.AAC.1